MNARVLEFQSSRVTKTEMLVTVIILLLVGGNTLLDIVKGDRELFGVQIVTCLLSLFGIGIGILQMTRPVFRLDGNRMTFRRFPIMPRRTVLLSGIKGVEQKSASTAILTVQAGGETSTVKLPIGLVDYEDRLALMKLIEKAWSEQEPVSVALAQG